MCRTSRGGLCSTSTSTKRCARSQRVPRRRRRPSSRHPPKELSEEALKKQGFLRPTKAQAFIGAALSVPLSALAYSVFAAERASFGGVGEPGALQDVALVGGAAVSLLSVVVGCALFLYAVNYTDKTE